MTDPRELDPARQALLRQRLAGRQGIRRTVIPVADRAGRLPLSFGQERLWFLSQLTPDSAEYQVPVVLSLRGALDLDALRTAYQQVLQRHEILRTRYQLSDARPVQVIDPPPETFFLISDLSSLPHPQRLSNAFDLSRRELTKPFDLSLDHPIRIRLIRMAEDEHVIVITVHHIAADGWSLGIFLRDLFECYGAVAVGQPPTWPPLPAQYADYAIWQRNRLADGVLARHLAYWREQLAGLAPLELPTDRSRGAVRDWSGEQVSLTVPPALANRLRELARQRRTTLFVVTLTALQLLLGRYAGQRDVAVGSALTSRNEPELQNAMGFFLDTVVLRARWSGDMPFLALLDRNRQTVLDGVDHQEAPLQALVDELGEGRDLSRTPLFQVMFDMVEARPDVVRVPGLEIAPLNVLGAIAKHDLRLELAEHADGSLRGSLEYASALFDEATASRITRHYLRLLASISADPGQPVSRLDMLDPAERQWLLDVGKGASVSRPQEPVVNAVARWARQTPEATAVAVGRTRLSYAELDARANQIAHLLLGRGLKPRSVVGICLARGADMLPVLLGVWRAGCAYVPLDPGDPPGRTAYVLRDCAAALVVTTSDRLGRFPPDMADRLVLADTQRKDIAAQPGTNPARQADPDDLAYLVYTSGSTGHPKGVLVTHRGLMNYLGWAAEAYMAPEGGAPLFTSIAFDLVVTTLYAPLLAGRPVHMLPPDYHLTELGALLAQSADGRYSFIKLTPAHLGALCLQLDSDRAAGLAARLVVGGDRFARSLASRWDELAGPDGARTVNEYGPTEVCVASVAHLGTESPQEPGHPPAPELPIGRPIPNTTAYLLDGELEPVPVGVVGDLYVGGAQLALGYHGKAGLTAARFVPDPYGPPGARLHRTGDLARRLRDGALEFAGRADSQVKIRGYRVEPGEVAAVLRQHPGVRDAAVTVRARSDALGGGTPTAYIVPAGASPPSAEELRAFVGQAVPEYMIPSFFLAVPTIPLTSNGKVDYRALPDPGQNADGAVSTTDQPHSAFQHRIAAIFRRVLGLGAVGIHDSFFDLGGDSVSAVALVGALRDEGVDTQVRDVFEYQTVAGLAEALSRRPATTSGDRRVEPFALLSPEDRAKLPPGVIDAYPVSIMQHGMLFEMLGASDGDTRYYHNATTYPIRDDQPLSLPALRAAAQLLVKRQEMLRTGFDLTSYSAPLQLVHSAVELPVGMQDLRSLPAHERDRAVRDYTSAQQSTLFDIGSPPLLRLFAHVTSDDGWQLTITECHPILEGWGYHLLLMDLIRWYRLIRDGEPVPDYEPLPVRYVDFIVAEQRSLASADERGYWKRIIATVPRLSLPAAWAGGPEEPSGPQTLQVMFIDVADGLRALARSAGVPLKSVLHAAHLVVISMLTREETFFTGLVCDTRPEATGADRLLGLFLNTVPFPFRSAARSWQAIVKDVFAQETELWPYRRYPVLATQRELSGRGGCGRLIEVLFNYLDFHSVDTEVVEWDSGIDDSYVEFGLAVTAFAQGVFSLRFHPARISRRNGERLAAMYRRVLMDMAADPDGGPYGCHLPPGEYERLVTDWNDTQVSYPVASLPELFEERARAEPAAAAVMAADGGTVTFADLNNRANRLARYLRGLGVGPETRVGLCLEDGVELLVGVLGIVKAGGVYVPLDPRHPKDRLAFVISDTGAAAVLTAGRLREQLPQAGPPLVCLDTDWHEIGTCSGEDLPPSTDPDSLAYIMYTSGSTGRPKGVMISHRSLVNYLRWAADSYGLDGLRGAPLLGSPAQDLPVTNYLVPLIAGRTVSLLPADFDIAALAGYLTRPGEASLVKLTPAHLVLLSQSLPDGALILPAHTAVVGGDILTAEAAAAWRRIAPRSRLVNEYGPTETVVGCTVFDVPAEIDATHSVPIGAPIANARAYVLDRDLRPTPIGVAGELYIGGAGVARGYLNDPAKTADAFLPDPYSPVPGGRCYRTGDLARYRPDGNLEFLGRVDDQVKFLGYRIEPGEIEARIAAYPGVSAAAVTVREDPPGHARLAGYVVSEEGNAPQLAGLHEFLSQTLPSHMLPSVFVPLGELPRTRAGKIDRQALPRPALPAPSGTEYVAPRNRMERALAEVWASVLGAERVGIEDHFIDLGGHSLAAMRVSALLRARHRILLSPQDVLRNPTVAALAAVAAGRAAPDAPAPGASRYRMLTGGQLLDHDDVLVWFRRSGTRPTLFCVHDSATMCFGDLAAELGPDRPVAAIQHPAMVDPARAGMPVPDLAGRYAAAIRAAVPGGPYHLIGWCAGISVAWEVARQLAKDGDPVVLCMLDPKLGDSADGGALSALTGLRTCEELIGQLRANPSGPDSAELRRRIMALLRWLFPEAVQEHDVRAWDVDEGWPEVVRSWREREEARLDYQIGPLRIPARLIASDEAANSPMFFCGIESFDGYVATWRDLAGGDLPVHRVPGWHDGMLRPPLVAEFARTLGAILDQLDGPDLAGGHS